MYLLNHDREQKTSFIKKLPNSVSKNFYKRHFSAPYRSLKDASHFLHFLHVILHF